MFSVPYFLIYFLLVTSSTSYSPLHIINTTNQFRDFTGISDFRMLNRRNLIQCPDVNPYLQVSTTSNNPLSNEENITVTVSGVILPDESDWVAMISPSNADMSSCPLNTLKYKQTGDFSSLPLLCHYPVKAQYMSNDPNYLSCRNKKCIKHRKTGVCVVGTCSGSLTFHAVNIRTDIEFVFFTGGFDIPCILKKSDPLSFASPQTPLYGHLSSIDSTGASKPQSPFPVIMHQIWRW